MLSHTKNYARSCKKFRSNAFLTSSDQDQSDGSLALQVSLLLCEFKYNQNVFIYQMNLLSGIKQGEFSKLGVGFKVNISVY